MAETLIEYAKGVEDDKARAIIELFPESVDFMGLIPFMTAPGGAFRYEQEGALPSNMGFRAINETPTAGHGLLNDLIESTYPIAGNLDVDRALIRRYGMDRRTREERMMVKAKAKLWADTFIYGDNATTSREFSGLQTRLKIVNSSVDGSDYDSRVVANSTAANGGALSLAQLDIAIGLVEDPTCIIMPKALKTRFAAAQRDTTIGGFITFDKDEMGEEVMRYGDLPIYVGYGITKFGPFLPFTETPYGGGTAATSSIYIVNFSDQGVCALQVNGMEVKDYGLIYDGVTYRTNIEHDVGMCVLNPYSAIRLSSITDAAITK